MQFPMIHTNGTAPAALFDAYMKAVDAARALEEALLGCAPNGRDYYPISAFAVAEATEEHRARMGKVESVRRDLEELAEFVSEKGGL